MLKKRTFWHEFYRWETNPNFCDYTEMVYTCVIRMLFDNNNTLANEFISNLCVYCRHGISHSYTWFYRHVGDDFNGLFLAGFC